ncbi:MAG: NAD(P)H-dependent oxidoreductase [Methanomicrobiales archaeon]|nr:NAD(P)H-dependent oxidoreductase [Methanomicrobiales archaeon]NYT21793.1 NAD(P)H-dependent oxidoreductase [Methanomicrobiales archaeon]
MTGQPQRVLLLVGSPRGMKSTSASLGSYLLQEMEKGGTTTAIITLSQFMKSDEGKNELVDAINRADTLVFASPLFIDSLPAPVIDALEMIRDRRMVSQPPWRQSLVALVNSGVPEPRQNATALAIYRQFAEEAEFGWAGGLAFAPDSVIRGKPLREAGFAARNARKSLELAAEALGRGGAVPQAAVNLADKPLVPVWMFLLNANRSWKHRVKDPAVWKEMEKRPFRKTA